MWNIRFIAPHLPHGMVGVFLWNMRKIVVDRVAVFLDYENVHRTGHESFADAGTPIYETVVNPIEIAERLVARRKFASELVAIYVFRGRPAPTLQPKPASANDIQAASWSADPRVRLVRRDLKYERSGGKFIAREKGIDVALAVALVETAMLGDYDAAIIFSGDTDLLPAIELAYRRTEPKIEIACWSSATSLWFSEGMKMDPPKRFPFCHFLGAQDFFECRDHSAD
jgi:uncharacterized LabA/DUF88 family protein